MKLTKSNIIKVLNKNDIDSIEESIEAIESYFTIIEQKFDLYLTINGRSNLSGDDYWLQAEYYSPKMQKTVIWDYSYPRQFDSIEDFAETIIATEKAISEYESKLLK